MKTALLLVCLGAASVFARPLSVAEAIDALEPGWRIPMTVSPDGQKAAYCLMQPSRKQPMLDVDHYRSQTGVHAETIGNDVWLADAGTLRAQNLTGSRGANFAPVWSPDGKRLAFVSDRDGAARLWVYEQGRLRRVSPETVWLGVGFERPAWTRDGQSLIVKLLPHGMTVRQAAGREHPAALLGTRKASELRKLPPRVYDFQPGSATVPTETRQGMRPAIADLARVDVATGKVERLVRRVSTSGWWVSPDGTCLAYSEPRGPISPTSQLVGFDLCLVDLRKGTSRTVASGFPSDFGMGVSWSPDSQQLAYFTQKEINDYEQADVYWVRREGGGQPRLLATGGYFQEERGPDWLDNTSLLLHSRESVVRCTTAGQVTPIAALRSRALVESPENGRVFQSGGRVFATTREGVAQIELASGAVETQAGPRHGGAVGVSGGPIFSRVTDVRMGHELDVSVDGLRTAKRVHHFNKQFADDVMGRPRLLEYSGPEGKPLKAALLLPPDYQPGRRYPMMVNVYGGSMGSGRLNVFGLEGNGCDNLHILASRGYVVMAPDIPIDKDPVRDIVAAVEPAVEAAVTQGFADPARVAVMGHSYGGYTTAALITHSKRFRAAVSRVGLSNLLNEYLTFEDGVSSHLAMMETGQGGMRCTPWENLARYVENSPVFHLDKVNTPLLIIQGDADNRAWVEEAGELFVGLRRLGKAVTYVSYPGEGHWEANWTRDHQLDYWERMLTFLRKCGMEA